MKRANRLQCCVAAFLAMTAGAAMAQRPEPPGIEMIIQGYQRAERDLKFSDEVAGKLALLREGLQAALEKECRDAGINLRDRSNKLTPEQRATYVEISGRRAREFYPKAAALLSPDQLKRLQQIDFQSRLKARAAGALLAEEVAAALKLTNYQRQTLSSLNSEYAAKQAEVGFDRAEYLDKAIGVLTDEQKATLAKLKGEELSGRPTGEAALAQQQREVPPFTFIQTQTPSVFRVHFAALEAVQKDLGVSDEVARKLTQLRDDYRATYKKACQDADVLQTGAQFSIGSEYDRKLQQIGRKLDEEFIPKVDELLSAEQQKRFQQILFQYLLKDRGPLALVAVASELKLTDEQQQKLTALDRELSPRPPGPKGRVPAPPRPGPMAKGREAAENRLLKVREYSTKAVEVLTAEQKATFDTLKGSEFDLDQLVIRGRTRDT